MKDWLVKILFIIAFLALISVVVYFIWTNLKSLSKKNGVELSRGLFEIKTPVDNIILPFSKSRALKLDKKDIGEKSNLYGKLIMKKNYSSLGLSVKDADSEYIYLLANPTNKDKVKISGLILKSLVSDKAAIIPKGTKVYFLGIINPTEDIYLEPGEVAIIHSGKSPLGASFKENRCSGYLANLYEFKPPLNTSLCPSASEILPNTVENVRKYGDACIDATLNMPRCKYFLDSNKYYNKVSKECRRFLKDNLNYNACVMKEKDKDSFFPFDANAWHIYLGRDEKIWKNKYEAIKLLDKDNKTIDILTY